MTKQQEKDTASIREVYGLVGEVRSELNNVALRIENKIDNLETNHLAHINTNLEKLSAEFAPIKLIVYGLVAIMLTSVIGALLFLILK